MSAGAFVLRGYINDSVGEINSILIQPETEQLTIDGVANTFQNKADINSGRINSAQRNSRKKKTATYARGVRFKFTGTPATGYLARSPLVLPWGDSVTFDGIQPGQVGSYLGQPIEVVGKFSQIPA